MMDCRELERVKVPSAFCSPNLCTKSGIIKHPYSIAIRVGHGHMCQSGVLTEMTPIS